MLFLPDAAGPADPVPTTIGRHPGSIRRTSNIDTARPDGFQGDLVMTARARDLRTGPDSSSSVLGHVELSVRISGTSRQVLSISATPPSPGLDQLVGCLVGPGFRSQVNLALPGEREAGTLLHLLLDDLPGAALVSGYAAQRGGVFERPPQPEPSPGKAPDIARMMESQDDLCAGWARDGTMMVTIRAAGEIPVSAGPPAPVLERDDDPVAWHAMEPLGAHSMRRRRRLDVLEPGEEDALHRIDVHFRDSHMDPTGAESVVHEYSVTGAFDADGGRVAAVRAEARVLPWMECPGALVSAERLSDMPIADLRLRVRREFTGTSSCTHLNDTLRSLGDVVVLAESLSG